MRRVADISPVSAKVGVPGHRNRKATTRLAVKYQHPPSLHHGLLHVTHRRHGSALLQIFWTGVPSTTFDSNPYPLPIVSHRTGLLKYRSRRYTAKMAEDMAAIGVCKEIRIQRHEANPEEFISGGMAGIGRSTQHTSTSQSN